MILKGKNYVKPEVTETKLAFPKKAMKTLIEEFVPEDGAKSYKEICQHVLEHYHKENKHFHSDDVLALVKEVDAEWHPVEE